MPPKKKIAPPIDRPLSKAYLRGFKGWSTAYPPGQSDPSTVRVMENMLVERNGALMVRPGLRYLSYLVGSDIDHLVPGAPGEALQKSIVGETELFYLEDGSRALLFAVRQDDGMVGFRVMLFTYAEQAVFELRDPEIGFRLPQGEDVLAFSGATNYVRYLQINNRILALSDAGEPARLFYVGAEKWAKTLQQITVPEWLDTDKLQAFQPDAAWINTNASSTEFNRLHNPAFEAGTQYWNVGPNTQAAVSPRTAPDSGRMLVLRSLPMRTNLATSPLVDVPTTGVAGWMEHAVWPASVTAADGMKVESTKPGRFYASSMKLHEGFRPRKFYRIAADLEVDPGVAPELLIDFYAVDGGFLESELRIPIDLSGSGRWVSEPFQTPIESVGMRVSFGGVASAVGKALQVSDVLICLDGEPTSSFSGDSGADYYWAGTPNASTSIHHPTRSVSVWSARAPITTGPLAAGAQLKLVGANRNVTVGLSLYDKDSAPTVQSVNAAVTGAWTRGSIALAGGIITTQVSAELTLTTSLGYGDELHVTEAMIVPGAAALPTYYDGSTKDTATVKYSWEHPLKPHESASMKRVYSGAPPALVPETPTAKTLVAAGGSANNPYKMAFFYTFENEVGESAPSKITEIRMQRAWSDWSWETATATGEPSGTYTDVAGLCADQIVVRIPQAVYDRALSEGALRWNLYGMTWSDQEPVPVTALLLAEKSLRTSLEVSADAAIPYEDGGWISVTPSRSVGSDELPLPTAGNRVNYSVPPRHRAGVVAGDRMILVGDPKDLASIQWTSNRPAESTNFTPSKGGGSKTLTSGNMNLPVDVVLWQNPQSIDTITILCAGDDGRSVSYYMSPAALNQGQSGMVSGMGFEQVTSTPGSKSGNAAQVINNALFRPLDYALLKSSANNYNINHKTQSDVVANMWEQLRGKQNIVSVQLDNRLYLLVHNPLGELLRPGCKGNEIWVYDVAAEAGTWSRFLIQANSLSVFSVRNRAFIGIGAPDGWYYLDEDARMDDYVSEDGTVLQRPIPWLFETNTQGANRAHDAWAHLHNVQVMLGNFTGTMRYGVRGQTVNGIRHEVEKIFTDDSPYDLAVLQWDVEDQLLVRRDFKEWVFFASSVPDKFSAGELSSVQYRYTPISVNVGYEYGSVETFEYGANVSSGPTPYSANGIPVAMMDYTRP